MNMDPDYVPPKPFNYKKYGYKNWRSFIEFTLWRLNFNSKVITVDGAIASGKTKFCKDLAEKLDFEYIPAPTFDTKYVNGYGYDTRQLDPELPMSTRSHELKDFFADPHHWNTTRFERDFLQLKLQTTFQALAHVLNTGQGVVLDTSVYAHFVYLDTMYKFGFLDKNCYKVLCKAIAVTVTDLASPHLSIYIDSPVERILQNVKERGRPEEQDSKFLKPEILTDLEEGFKTKFATKMGRRGEVMILDSEVAKDISWVVEDIEGIDFDNYRRHGPKFIDWQTRDEHLLAAMRYKYTELYWMHKLWCIIPDLNVPQLMYEAKDLHFHDEIMASSPGGQYAFGYNKDMGDSFWFK